MRAGNGIVVACQGAHGEKREVSYRERGGGGAHILQICSGALTRLAYGEQTVCQRLSLDARGLEKLSTVLGWHEGALAGATRFFADGDAVLADMLDVCSRAGIVCTFCTVGSEAGMLSVSVGVSAAYGPSKPRLKLVP